MAPAASASRHCVSSTPPIPQYVYGTPSARGMALKSSLAD
jgi:hypothetical protein